MLKIEIWMSRYIVLEYMLCHKTNKGLYTVWADLGIRALLQKYWNSKAIKGVLLCPGIICV